MGIVGLGAAAILCGCGGASAPKTPGASGVSQTTPGVAPPPAAESVASRLVSPSAAVAHSALAPAASALAGSGPLFPAGSTLQLGADSWHQSGRAANATASVTTKGGSPHTYEIGFLQTPDGWRVTFATKLS